MPTPPVKPAAPPPPGSAPVSGSRDPQIVTIPESYYAVAVNMQPPFITDEDAKPAETPAAPVKPIPPPPAPVVPAPIPAEHHSRLWLVALVVFVLLAAGGTWIALNRDLLFGPKPTPPTIVQKPAAPNAPTSLTVASPAPGVTRLEWQDHSETEDGYRVERKNATDVGFVPIQTLPANSLTFLDPTAPAGTRVTYQVIAFNVGGDSTSSNLGEVDVTPLPPPAPAAPTLPPDGLDLDSDGLTDAEELVYGSNAQLPDTDSDGYLDGNEVFNLYAPTVHAPATLLSLPTMQTVSSTIGWQTLVPKNWAVDTLSTSADVFVRVPSGESFVFRVEPNLQKQDIRAWLVAQKGLRADQIIQLSSNKYRLPFFLGSDRLTAYIPWEDQVLTVSYQLGTQTFVNFRTSFGMILNALRFTTSPKVPDLTRPVAIPSVFQAGTATSTLPDQSTSTISAMVTSTLVAPVSSSSRP